jgi:hypothetical protein
LFEGVENQPHDDSLLQNVQLDPRLDGEEENDPGWSWSEIPIKSRPTKNVLGVMTPVSGNPTFRGPPRGPRNIPDGCNTESDFFKLIMTESIAETFVANTNAHATASGAKKGSRGFCVFTKESFYSLLGAFIFMGISRRPNLEQHFKINDIFSSKFIKERWPLKQFQFVMKHLHYKNTFGMSDAEKNKKIRKMASGRFKNF